ncbi:GNAT family N-acetyltransferase [Polaribacter pacificus]|uniref:GNAT family N-acetyltransferase n=1 Tax=Polaribacter pacificus TaxID=1775173 RepID=A0A917HSR8_9FLAO|nr:GNAT family protein [Polaribacter pacificus]GGG88076.1 GNAT family N-acetyltransferase [Polaribacter pacificus]
MIKLEKFEKSDYNRLINWIDSERLMVVFGAHIFEYPITPQQLAIYTAAPNRLVYKVTDIKTQEVIGHAELNTIDYKNDSARICRVLVGNNNSRNKGYGTLIIKELIRIGFEDLQLHRLDLGVYDFNKQAIRCYKKCGFKMEGILKENCKFKNQYWSTYNMSILKNNR